MVQEHQNFKQSPGIFIFDICRAAASGHDKPHERVKLNLPLNNEPAIKHRDNFARSNRLKGRTEMARLGPFDLGSYSAVNFVFAKLFWKNCQKLIHDRQPFRVVLPLRFADEIMNPEITVALQRAPNLFSYMLEKKDVMKRRLRHDQIECFR